MMSYDVRMADVDAVGSWILGYTSTVNSQVQSMMQAAQGVASLEGFQGAAAESVKAYWGEVHVSALAAISAALDEVAVRYALYMGNYSAIDGSGSARFGEPALTSAYATCSSSRGDFSGKCSRLSGAVAGVSDLVGGWTPSGSGVDGALADLAERARWLRDRVSEHESWHAADAARCDALISSARQFVSSLGSGGGGGVSYAPGSIASAPSFAALASSYGSSAAYLGARASDAQAAYEALSQRMQAREEERLAQEAEARRQMGIVQMGIAAITATVGCFAIVFTAGAAAPVVVGAVCVVGAFQASNFVEGAQNFYYGAKGDTTSFAFNPLRDTLFMGNQKVYDGAEFVLTAAATLAVPASAAVGFARATGSSVTKCVGVAAKSLAIESGKDMLTDVGLGMTADRLIDRTLGTGVAGTLAKEALHQGAGLLGIKGGKPGDPPVPPPGYRPGTASTPIRVEGVDLPESFFKGPFKPGATVGKPIDIPTPKTKAEILAANAAKGKAYAAERFAEFKQRYPNAVSEVTIELDDGTRIRVDAVAVDENGKLVIQEYKSSKTAGFTKNQIAAYRNDEGVLRHGGTIVGKKGVDAFGEGVRIEVGDIVKVIRPD